MFTWSWYCVRLHLHHSMLRWWMLGTCESGIWELAGFDSRVWWGEIRGQSFIARYLHLWCRFFEWSDLKKLQSPGIRSKCYPSATPSGKYAYTLRQPFLWSWLRTWIWFVGNSRVMGANIYIQNQAQNVTQSYATQATQPLPDQHRYIMEFGSSPNKLSQQVLLSSLYQSSNARR